jgi:prophage regulatory protein
MSSKPILVEIAARNLSPIPQARVRTHIEDVVRLHEKFLRLPAVIERTGRSKTAIYTDPTFPKPIKISKMSSAWLESEVNEWMAERVKAARDASPR